MMNRIPLLLQLVASFLHGLGARTKRYCHERKREKYLILNNILILGQRDRKLQTILGKFVSPLKEVVCEKI